MTTQLPANLISSQKFLREDIVAAKAEAGDFIVVTQEIELDGEMYLVLVDGHHRLHAALRAGETPDFVRASDVGDYDIGCRSVEQWLESIQNDCDWYYVATGKNVW